jgi:hypothetical protein
MNYTETIGDSPNYVVVLYPDCLAPDPVCVAVEAYDEYDAIDQAASLVAERDWSGYLQYDEPEFPEDYIQVAAGYVPVQNVIVRKYEN